MVRLLLNLPNQTFFAILAIILIEKFNASPMDVGVLHVYGGISGMLFAGRVVPHLLERFHEKSILLSGILMISLFGILLYRLESYLHFYLALTLCIAGISMCQTICDSWLARIVNHSESSMALSMAWFLESSLRIVTPYIGRQLLINFGLKGITYNFILFDFIAFCVVWSFSGAALWIFQFSKYDSALKLISYLCKCVCVMR